MAKRGESNPAEHPLVVLLKRIRARHEISLRDMEICMGLPPDTLRHILKGRRLLPGIQEGLKEWIENFLRCAQATPEEQEQVRRLLARLLLLDWSEDLDAR
jgi:transcriptional regulator with XRE-family HTH domain